MSGIAGTRPRNGGKSGPTGLWTGTNSFQRSIWPVPVSLSPASAHWQCSIRYDTHEVATGTSTTRGVSFNASVIHVSQAARAAGQIRGGGNQKAPSGGNRQRYRHAAHETPGTLWYVCIYYRCCMTAKVSK